VGHVPGLREAAVVEGLELLQSPGTFQEEKRRGEEMRGHKRRESQSSQVLYLLEGLKTKKR
jgi:hypothetical protein